ncbi:MAG: protein-disulfide reductase DsbD domain-containing protein [Pseudomonadota bacterium]
MERRIACTLSALALTTILASPVGAQALFSTGQSFVTAELIPGAPEADGTRMIGLDLLLEPEWKTYWRSPGEAGIPPTIDWSASDNLAGVEVYWPAPEVFQSFGMTTVGYEDQVTLPIKITPVDPTRPVDLNVTMDLGVCREICVLEHTTLSQLIPADMTEGIDRVLSAMASVPASGHDMGMERAVCAIRGAGKDRNFSASLTFDHEIEEPTVLLEGPDGIWFHSAETVGQGSQIDVEATLSILFDDAWISRKDVRMTVLADGMAVDVQGCEAPTG